MAGARSEHPSGVCGRCEGHGLQRGGQGCCQEGLGVPFAWTPGGRPLINGTKGRVVAWGPAILPVYPSVPVAHGALDHAYTTAAQERKAYGLIENAQQSPLCAVLSAKTPAQSPNDLLHMQGYDAAYSLPAIAPRPLLIANGELDPRCPIAGLEAPVLAAQQAYKEMGCPQNLKVYYEKGLPHAPSQGIDNAVNAWLDLHLLQPR